MAYGLPPLPTGLGSEWPCPLFGLSTLSFQGTQFYPPAPSMSGQVRAPAGASLLIVLANAPGLQGTAPTEVTKPFE